MPPRSATELWQLLRAQAEAGRREAPALADGLARALLQPDDLAGALARELPPEEGGPRPAAPSAPGATAVDNARARAREAVRPG